MTITTTNAQREDDINLSPIDNDHHNHRGPTNVDGVSIDDDDDDTTSGKKIVNGNLLRYSYCIY